MAGRRIAVVDDDAHVRSLIRRSLEAESFDVDEAADRASLLRLLDGQTYDLITLDINLPDCNGIDLARDLRGRGNTPIIIVTGRDDVIDRVVGLEVGADDYIAKPFHVRELVARVRSVLRRSAVADEPPSRAEATEEAFAIGGLHLVPDRNLLLDAGGEPVDLTPSEFEALAALARAGGRTLSRDAILDATHPHDCESFDRAVDNLIARMRKKLPEGTIRTVRARGYQLAVPVRRTSILWPPRITVGGLAAAGGQ
jgi:DNA-binding response OmpR family regulator